MPLTRWFFGIDKSSKSIHIYETTSSDTSNAKLLRKRGAGSKELGPVTKLTTTEGKSKALREKYGVEYGIGVSRKVTSV